MQSFNFTTNDLIWSSNIEQNTLIEYKFIILELCSIIHDFFINAKQFNKKTYISEHILSSWNDIKCYDIQLDKIIKLYLCDNNNYLQNYNIQWSEINWMNNNTESNCVVSISCGDFNIYFILNFLSGIPIFVTTSYIDVIAFYMSKFKNNSPSNNDCKYFIMKPIIVNDFNDNDSVYEIKYQHIDTQINYTDFYYDVHKNDIDILYKTITITKMSY